MFLRWIRVLAYAVFNDIEDYGKFCSIIVRVQMAIPGGHFTVWYVTAAYFPFVNGCYRLEQSLQFPTLVDAICNIYIQ